MNLSKAERRRLSEQRILRAARQSFAERGFERTTIRAVAAAAGVDPALVMQYFGSKQELFGQAVRATPDGGETGDGELIEQLMASLGVKLGGLPPTTLAMLRSMLTHPDAAESVRAALGKQIDLIGAALPGDDARLRAALVVSVMLGIMVGDQFLGLGPLRDASREEIGRLVRPALQALLEEQDAS